MADQAGPQPAEHSGVVVFRPRRLRILVIVASIGLTALCLGGWFTFPGHVRVLVTWSQRVTLLGVLVVLVATMVAAAASFVRMDDDGVAVRNGLRTHAVPWPQVHKIILRPGDPWALLLLKPADGRPFEVDLDADKRQLMGIQANDGPLAQAAVEALRERHRRFLARH